MPLRPCLPGFALAMLVVSLATTGIEAQTPVEPSQPPALELPQHLKTKLSSEDQVLLTQLLNINIESAWAFMRTRGYPRSFINAIQPVVPSMRFAGRARTMRYLPYRQDLDEQIEGLQLNYRSAEDTEPGDVLVFDIGGELESSPSGDVTSTRAMVRGAAGIVVDGAMRDVPAFVEMGLPLFTRDGRGHASSVTPLMMSWDYQVPVRIGDVTVIPGDYLVGALHGILVIPAHIVEDVLADAELHSEREEFQRMLILNGESMIGVYPPNEETLQRFEEWRKRRPQP